MKTLYISDLDGTLLSSQAVLSPYTVKTINALIGRGMVFSYATARSLRTAKQATRALVTRVPLVVYNGAFLMDQATELPLLSNHFEPELQNELFDAAQAAGVQPILFSLVEGKDRFSFLEDTSHPGIRAFLSKRQGDPRARPVRSGGRLNCGEGFDLLCIDTPERLDPLYERYRDRCNCVYQVEQYTGHLWLELMPAKATKSNAVRQLKRLLNCDRVVAFGDGVNDIDLFQLADECYAVDNASPQLKAIATGVIGSNDADGVARWLEEHCLP